MRAITKYVTFDGAEHTTQKNATCYLDKMYSDCLTSLAHKTVCVEKYSQMASFINDNLDKFLQLKHIQDDMNMIEPNED